MSSMTIDELLQEIAAAQVGDEGLTGPEWGEVMGTCPNTTQNRIRLLLKAGKLRLGKAPRTASDGRTWMRPVYRIVE